MIRVLLSFVLAVALSGAGAASAVHARAHDAPHLAQDMDADRAAARADCCDAAGAGGPCVADAVPSQAPPLGGGPFAGRAIHPSHVRASAGIGAAVPTGPPKV